MNKNRYLFLEGCLFALASVLLLIIGVFEFSEFDKFGKIFGIIFLSFLIHKSYFCFNKIKKTGKTESVYAPPKNVSNEEVSSYYKTILFISIPAFLLLSVWTYYDLKELETGSSESIIIWEPIWFLYKIGGFWLAVLSTPILGIACCLFFWKRIKK